MLPPNTAPLDPPILEADPEAVDAAAARHYRRIVWFGRTLAASIGFLASATVVTLVFWEGDGTFLGETGSVVGLGACLGASLAAPMLWSWLVPDGRSFRAFRGLLAGVLAVLVAHITMWLPVLPVFVAEALAEPSLGGMITVIAEGIGGIFAIAFLSVIVVGIFTVPIGAVAGELVTWLCRWRLKHPVTAQ